MTTGRSAFQEIFSAEGRPPRQRGKRDGEESIGLTPGLPGISADEDREPELPEDDGHEEPETPMPGPRHDRDAHEHEWKEQLGRRCAQRGHEAAPQARLERNAHELQIVSIRERRAVVGETEEKVAE